MSCRSCGTCYWIPAKELVAVERLHRVVPRPRERRDHRVNRSSE